MTIQSCGRNVCHSGFVSSTSPFPAHRISRCQPKHPTAPFSWVSIFVAILHLHFRSRPLKNPAAGRQCSSLSNYVFGAAHRRIGRTKPCESRAAPSNASVAARRGRCKIGTGTQCGTHASRQRPLLRSHLHRSIGENMDTYSFASGTREGKFISVSRLRALRSM